MSECLKSINVKEIQGLGRSLPGERSLRVRSIELMYYGKTEDPFNNCTVSILLPYGAENIRVTYGLKGELRKERKHKLEKTIDYWNAKIPGRERITWKVYKEPPSLCIGINLVGLQEQDLSLPIKILEDIESVLSKNYSGFLSRS